MRRWALGCGIGGWDRFQVVCRLSEQSQRTHSATLQRFQSHLPWPPNPPAQACNGLPESGVCDGATWRKLLGEGSTPADIAILAERESLVVAGPFCDACPGKSALWGRLA